MSAARHPLRDALARSALADIPKVLTLMDRVPVSPTFGCFDRAYWHYRIVDFPCGMSQEFVLPLALVWALDLPDNPYRGQAEVRRWVIGGIRFAARAAHADGSCDDYYPFERATGAGAFSLLAMLDAAEIVGLEPDAEIDAFFVRRARWLAGHRESGHLANHEALILACLVRMAARPPVAGQPDWEAAVRTRLARLASWQSTEGWFDEYGGADPGYLSLTIGLLADSDRRRPDLGLRPAIRRAVAFLAALVHPDGTVGGEYTSRGTRNFFPHGFEIAGEWLPEARAVNDRALRPLAEGRDPCFADDHIVGHHMWSRLLAWREWGAERPGPVPLPDAGADWPAARLALAVAGEDRLYIGPTRGGAFRLYRGESLLCADTGPTLRMRDGRVAVTTIEGGETVERVAGGWRIAGRMAWARTHLLTPFRSVVLRLGMLTVGRLWPDGVRRALQALLVTGRRNAPFRYERTVRCDAAGWTVTDRIVPDRDWAGVAEAGLGNAQTAAATVMARVWQVDQLAPWQDWTPRLAALSGAAALEVVRTPGRES